MIHLGRVTSCRLALLSDVTFLNDSYIRPPAVTARRIPVATGRVPVRSHGLGAKNLKCEPMLEICPSRTQTDFLISVSDVQALGYLAYQLRVLVCLTLGVVPRGPDRGFTPGRRVSG